MQPYYYKSIPGWFTFEYLYRRIIDQLPQDSIFVEVGCWFGKSICFAAEYSKLIDKDIVFFAVDNFLGTTTEPSQKQIIKENGGSIYLPFLKNIGLAGVSDRVLPLTCNSVVAAKHIKDGTVGFCLIDATHEFKDVVQDIKAWRPKIKPGGILAGHDWHLQTVRNAVKEFWGDVEVDAKQNCWMKRL